MISKLKSIKALREFLLRRILNLVIQQTMLFLVYFYCASEIYFNNIAQNHNNFGFLGQNLYDINLI